MVGSELQPSIGCLLPEVSLGVIGCDSLSRWKCAREMRILGWLELKMKEGCGIREEQFEKEKEVSFTFIPSQS